MTEMRHLKNVLFFFSKQNKLYFNEDSADAVLNYDEICIVNIDLSNNSLDDNLDEDNCVPIILIRLLAWHNKFEKCKELKKKISEELMPAAWLRIRWWNFCVPEDEKNEIKPIFIE